MRLMRGFTLLLFFCATPVLKADVTVRYKTDFKMGSLLPPEAAQQISNAQKTQLTPFLSNMMIQIKGDKAHSNLGPTDSLVDFSKQQITMIDKTRKLYATVYMKDFPGEIGAAMPEMPALPPMAQKIMESVKSNFSARKTGRTDTILGVQVEESELTLTMDLPVPADLPIPPGIFKPGEIVTITKMVMQIWTATGSELARVPGLSEWAAHMTASQLMNPAAAMQQTLGKLPGVGGSTAPMTDYFSKNTAPMLKSHVEMYLPIMARLTQLLQAAGQKPPAEFNADAPLVEMNSEVVEISSAALDDSVFEIPADYRATNMSDLFKSLMPDTNTPRPPDTSVPVNP